MKGKNGPIAPKPPKEEKSFHDVLINGGPLGKSIEVYLDGFRLKGVTSLQWTATVHDVVRLQIELIVDTKQLQYQFAEAVSTIESTTGDLTDEEIATLPPPLAQIHADLMKMKES